MANQNTSLSVRLAASDSDLQGAWRLRYTVFCEELGGDGALVDHDARFERDAFDQFFEHLILVDARKSVDRLEHVVGVYRVMGLAQMQRAGRFYGEDEYDLDPLKASGRNLLELGRSCVHQDYRGGLAMYHLWQGLANYVEDHEIEVLFGVASFHGTDPQAIAQPLANLYHDHLAPADLRPRARVYQPMDLVPATDINKRAAMRATPSLIKAYLRLGGVVGDGAYIDHDFNTVDVCLVMDTARLSARHREIYTRPRAG
ncbi:GNAT family N-acetyltransferase [Litoreibacter roseus]|uniref:GNAT family N-acetyltransferase n=1 Tax=Litoreibacter roseus TaxID=2601869 RepID=UPI003570BA0A